MADLRIDAHHRGERGKYDGVEVVVADLESVRALAVVPGVRARHVLVRTDDGTVLAEHVSDTRVAVHDVVADLGRQSVWPATVPPAGLGTDGIDVRVHNPTGLVLDGSPVPPVGDLDAGQVARLALQGVPMSADSVPPALAAELGDQVTAAILAPVADDDLRATEEHSIVLRRAAFDRFAGSAGSAGRPSVSILLATRRPDMVEHALSQVARQRGVGELELVLTTHGFGIDPTRLPEAVGPASVRLLAQDSDAVFGDVLNAAAAAASGELVLKMDDDDWYSPDFVADLLRARAYSGADLVGVPDDLYFLEDRDLTLSLGHQGEVFRGFVAGGSMLLSRAALESAGGFRSVPRHVDAGLIEDLRAAGGTVYRTHAFGYVMRRTASGHTWDADLDDLVARAVRTWPGFLPGRLMEL